MSKYICVDTSVFIKLFFEEEDSLKAKELMQTIAELNQIIVLPSFAWAELGSILRKKMRTKQITPDAAGEMWLSFINFPGIEYMKSDLLLERSWRISSDFNLPTLYDAAFLATAEIIKEKTKNVCEFWTADERLITSLRGNKDYVHMLKALSSSPYFE
jgi:predicted nucleic acid-binding protein